MLDADLQTISDAFQAREFFLLYQPIVCLHDRRCAGAEALIRWRRGDTTIVDACGFIPQTEDTPLAGTITYWVIDTVAEDLGEWMAAHEEALIGINVPPEILGRGGLEYAAQKSGLRAHAKQLILEITERGIPDRLGLEALKQVPSTGARVALDDTTLSGANLALLMRCPFDFVKIDGLLVQDLAAGNARPKWLGGLGALLAKTQLQIIAEGVETEVQARILRDAGVQLAQGHLFSVPVSAEEFKRFYAASNS